MAHNTINTTTIMNSAIIKWLQTSDAFLSRTIAQVIIAVILLSILSLFGSYRRRSRSSVLRLLLWMAYTISGSLVAYTIGQMESGNFHNEQFLVWALFLLIVLGSSSYSVSAYSLDDASQWKRQMSQQIIQFFGVALLANSYREKYTSVLPLYILWFLCLIRLLDQAYAFGKAGQSGERVKLVADYMTLEHQLSNEWDVDPQGMRGYKYLVAREEISEMLTRASPQGYHTTLNLTDKAITLERIWQCGGGLLSTQDGDPDTQLKDICLSFALFKLLQRRFAGYHMAESNRLKTNDFVLRGLLADYDRAFRVIEVELAFLYDFFHNKYSYTFTEASPLPTFILSLLMIALSSWVVALLVNYKPRTDEVHLELKHGGSVDLIVGFLIVFSVLCLEIWLLITYALSDWVKVALICKYVSSPSWQGKLYIEKVLGSLCRKRVFKPWSNSLGQYSLLESFRYQGWFPGLRKLINRCQPFYNWPINKGRKDGEPIKLEKEVKRAVLDSLAFQLRMAYSVGAERRGRRTSTVILSGGKLLLMEIEVFQMLGWALQFGSQIEKIFVWHVATILCDIELKSRVTGTAAKSDQYIVATSLSGYCAYLQVFAPELLPDQSYITTFIFEEMLQDVNNTLGQCKTMKQMYEKMIQDIPTDKFQGNVIQKGAHLGKQLIREMNEELRWKVLANFWADYMLYLSASEKPRGHAEHLADGGEFITHLWALLSHAGVVERSQLQYSNTPCR